MRDLKQLVKNQKRKYRMLIAGQIEELCIPKEEIVIFQQKKRAKQQMKSSKGKLHTINESFFGKKNSASSQTVRQHEFGRKKPSATGMSQKNLQGQGMAMTKKNVARVPSHMRYYSGGLVTPSAGPKTTFLPNIKSKNSEQNGKPQTQPFGIDMISGSISSIKNLDSRGSIKSRDVTNNQKQRIT